MLTWLIIGSCLAAVIGLPLLVGTLAVLAGRHRQHIDTQRRQLAIQREERLAELRIQQTLQDTIAQLFAAARDRS